MSFAALKRSSGTSVAALQDKIKKEQKGNYNDDRLWKLEVDASGNGSAVIRFLPAPEGEESPYVLIKRRIFKYEKTGKWYIENCLTTIGKDDPVGEHCSELWNSGVESNKDIARERKRKDVYIANIYVIKDPKNPQNEGKNFLFEFGPKIFEKIQQQLQPEFDDVQAFDPFDFWTGANFKLKAITKNKQRSYDLATFDEPSALFGGDDEKLETLWKKQYSLAAEIAPDKFKTYDELKKRYAYVLGGAAQSEAKNANEASTRESESIVTDTKASSEPVVRRQSEQPRTEAVSGDDDTSAYAALLADD